MITPQQLNVPQGAEYKIEEYILTVQLKCKCGTSFLIVGQVGAERDCPNCPRFVRLDGFAWDQETKNIRLQLSFGVAEPTPVPVDVSDFIPTTAGTSPAPGA